MVENPSVRLPLRGEAVSHREEFSVALAHYFGAVKQCERQFTPVNAAASNRAYDEVVRLYDEKPPAREDLVEVARETAKVFSYSEQDISFAANLGVTRYLASRESGSPAK